MRPHRLLLILLSSLLWTAHAEAQTIDLPAMIRCKAEGERASSRSQLIEIWLSRAEKRDAIAAFCLAYVQSDKVHVPLGWLEQSARLNLPDAQLLMGTNYEVGFKTTWADNRLRFNGAVFQDDWDDFQYSFLGQSGLTEIRNAGQARIKGIETDLVWAMTDAFTLSSSMSWLDAKTAVDYCGTTYGEPNVTPDDARFGRTVTDCDDPAAPDGTYLQAPEGQELPVQPKFKANAVGRFEFAMGENHAHVQVAAIYQGAAWSDLRTAERELLGRQPSFTIVDFSGGFENDSYGVELFVKNAFDERAEIERFAECSIYQPGTQNGVALCGLQPYTVTNLPRTIGVTFSKKF